MPGLKGDDLPDTRNRASGEMPWMQSPQMSWFARIRYDSES